MKFIEFFNEKVITQRIITAIHKGKTPKIESTIKMAVMTVPTVKYIIFAFLDFNLKNVSSNGKHTKTVRMLYTVVSIVPPKTPNTTQIMVDTANIPATAINEILPILSVF